MPQLVAVEDHRIEADSAKGLQPSLRGRQQRSTNALSAVVRPHSEAA